MTVRKNNHGRDVRTAITDNGRKDQEPREAGRRSWTYYVRIESTTKNYLDRRDPESHNITRCIKNLLVRKIPESLRRSMVVMLYKPEEDHRKNYFQTRITNSKGDNKIP